jgi:ribosome-associated heat shock protein Hsp15
MKVRVDKFLHAVRIYKTRSLSTSECGLGKVRVNGTAAKASREIQANDEIVVHYHGYFRAFRVIQILEKRIGAPLVEKYILETTPEEEMIKKDMIRINHNELRQRGAGRPTKKERREIEKIKGTRS